MIEYLPIIPPPPPKIKFLGFLIRTYGEGYLQNIVACYLVTRQ
jgi:hypothetical protein